MQREGEEMKVECRCCGKEFEPGSLVEILCNECTVEALLIINADKYKISRGRFAIFERDNFQCFYCGRTSYGDKVKLHVDHIIPSSKGGSNRSDNLVTSCSVCNLSKNDGIIKNIESLVAEIIRRNKEHKLKNRTIIKLKL